MEPLAAMNRAMQYIEDNLTQEINPQELSRIACCSEHHFRRMFSFLSGIGLSEYIRRRKLTVAAAMLQTEGATVIDVALQLGYGSPDAFAKAFQTFHGVTPSQVKKGGALITAFPQMTFRLTIQGGIPMNYRIVEKEAFSIVGIKKRVTLIYEGVNPQMESLWRQLTDEIIAELKSLSNTEPLGILSVSANFTEGREEGTELDQYIGVATMNAAPEHYEVLSVLASQWAVFTSVGEFPKAMQETWARIYSEWFPTSGYELTSGPEIVWSESPDTEKRDYKCEIWIPVGKAT
jgi:AraC family transcriptional regulator